MMKSGGHWGHWGHWLSVPVVGFPAAWQAPGEGAHPHPINHGPSGAAPLLRDPGKGPVVIFFFDLTVLPRRSPWCAQGSSWPGRTPHRQGASCPGTKCSVPWGPQRPVPAPSGAPWQCPQQIWRCWVPPVPASLSMQALPVSLSMQLQPKRSEVRRQSRWIKTGGIPICQVSCRQALFSLSYWKTLPKKWH